MKKTYAINEVIFRQGDSADCMYEVKSGCVSIYANYGASNEKLLTKLTAGATFGEMGLVEKMPRSATAVAAEDNTQIQVITIEGFADYFWSNPENVLSIMKHMSSRIRGLTNDYLDACRAITEYEENAAGGKKSGWLKENIKRFMQDYVEATNYLNQHPDMYSGMHGYQDYYFL